ncbi:autoinducer 2 ABC transporter substrate-binding protein [Agrococcus sp. Marseille-Q4369]|uniref:autoinducer 2 ABC transporter substrate-binding protein n=1 Tax=unclassified Agrococcus TaxID=2615065 RepID=UPI001B8B7DE6|nr:autoinducer 2 ABC transporter substrate-binding protein [Agrococcus sp. Marseille-Q4369]QUW17902.1 autoinducer 2 ABC transporter substrate-binding protein [Agrococcus sp. Marseille-Q4369]
MKISRKIAGALALSAAAAVVLAGCTSRNTDTGSSAEPGATDGASAEGLTIAFVPKLQGIPYFEAMNTGGQQAAEELGFEWLYQGPTTADAAAQADIVRSFIQQGVDVLFVAPNDPNSMAPLLQEAQAAGIHVATTDTDAPDSVREVFVSQASVEGIGQQLTDSLLEAMGGSGKYAIVSCGETAANLNAWIEVQEAYTASEYPDAEIVDIVYAGEDQAMATQMATDLMNSHPDLTGLVGECTSSAPGVAQAVQDADRIGEVFTVGLGTPQSMLPYLESGASSGSILWDVEGLGYLTGWAGVQLATDGDLGDTSSLSNEALSEVEYDEATGVLLLGPPTVFTAENAGDYDY